MTSCSYWRGFFGKPASLLVRENLLCQGDEQCILIRTEFMMFPKFLLKKMYVRGSLKKETSGFSYVIRNNIANGTIIEVYSLKVDGKEIPFHNVEIVIEGRS